MVCDFGHRAISKRFLKIKISRPRVVHIINNHTLHFQPNPHLMRKIAFFCIALAFFAVANSQTKNHWKENNAPEKVKTHKTVARPSFPKTFKAFDLDVPAFQQELMSIVGKAKTANKVKVSFPNADGGVEEFELVEASNFEPALQERFPEIRAYSGKGITDPYATIKVSFSPDGVQTMTFRADKQNEFIEKFSEDKKTYAVFRSQRQPGALPWECTTKAEQQMVSAINDQVMTLNTVARSGNNLKTMRLAQSCNAEYSNYFGAFSSADVSKVLAAFNATLTRCNGVYEKDLALHLNLIASTTAVIYYNPSTDPYSTTQSSWNSTLQSTLNSVIGAASYDIGHLFCASGGNGNAGCIGCICVDASKGSAFTSSSAPFGDSFDIDYVAHEIGHQLGANHTFSMSNEGTGVNKEVGSGITIMGYAGITSQDIARNSIDIFHQASIQQIQNNLNTKTCPVTLAISANNTAPTVAPLTNYTIPISTPFALTGSATDAENDPLTYSWEQNDNASSTQTGASSVASTTKATGPNWISSYPSLSPVRLFPRLSTILAGSNVSGPLAGGDAGANTEALSSVGRTLNFRLTVRDNAPYNSSTPEVGQTQFTDVVITVSTAGGPFAVTAPNTAVSWPATSTQTITWNAGGTAAAPFNSANVKISLSTDGGNTFPTVLAASTPNDGSEVIAMPSTQTTTARIKIEAIGNIFFDISNTNFTISTPPLCGDAAGLSTTSITNNSANISWNAVANATSYAVDFKLNSAATWTELTASQAGTSASLTGLAANSAYNWRVRATCPAGTGNNVQANFTTLPNCGNATGLTTGSITSNSAAISWTAVANATSYRVEFKTAAATTWTTLTAAQAGTTANLTGLAAGTTYIWQVQSTCPAGTGNFVQSANFTTTVLSCASTLDNGTNGTINGAAVIPFNTNVTGLINVGSDVDLYRFTITTGGTISLSLTTLPANYNLQLLNSTGGVVVTSNRNGTNSESISNRTVTAGTYYARVYPNTTSIFNATTCYTLRVSLGTASRSADDFVGGANGILVEEAGGAVKTIAYPNPVKDLLNISMASAGNEISLFNSRGEQVMKTKAAEANSQLDVSKLASGLYLVKITKDGKLVNQLKVVKQ